MFVITVIIHLLMFTFCETLMHAVWYLVYCPYRMYYYLIITIVACDTVKYHEFVAPYFNECVARVEML